jgi:hypothetical protein
MALEIETRRDIARLRQRQLPGRHELPGARETVGDHDHRADRARFPHHRDRGLPRAQVRDVQPRARTLQQDDTGQKREDRHTRHQEACRHLSEPSIHSDAQ